MPLKTKTVDLRDERDRLDDELDELAEREAELRHELEGLEDADDDTVEAEAQRLYREIQDVQEDAQQTQTYLTGIAVTIDEFGERVATDGGTDTDSASESDDLARAREQMQSDGADVVADQPTQDAQGNAVGGASGPAEQRPDAVPADVTDSSSGRESGGSDAETGSQTAGALSVTFGGLTAGEYAQAADLANAAERGRIGFAESGAGEGRTRNIFVAAGTHDAPYLSQGMDLNAKADAVADLSPDFVQWCEEQVMELTSPPEAVGNGYSQRVERIMEAKRNGSEEPT